MYVWPEGLEQLGAYLQKRQIDICTFKTARQAAWTAQQLLKTRIKFSEDLYVTLREIQKAVPQRESALTGAPQKRNETADRKEAPTAAARSVAKRSKSLVHTQQPAKVNHHPDISVGWNIFCDGGCEPNPGAGGWGLVVYKDGREIAALSGGLAETTNNCMELTGMLQAARWVIEHFMKDEPATIWSDSRYVVDGCNDWRHKWKRNGWSKKGPNSRKRDGAEIKNLDLWKAIDEDFNKCTALTISWVKGHVGIAGNERADELALIGREEAMAVASMEEPAADYLDAECRQIMRAI
ncbi:ribonuclease HI [Agrobacterium rhizogenes]|uniref:ribonuclease H family protein n=1 Tax=Rhizobium rhizogenes TaxID=359 RepID=UPI00157374E9|nr:ribonuclease H [Rhizobium rhizogenes]NTI01931.1 ribonuclease HI [Rhizobium rhizogenes]NTI08734.1 ribonuclease HI [Rhizobium rhizogenes]